MKKALRRASPAWFIYRHNKQDKALDTEKGAGKG
jgi:hypothetical protein